MDLVGNATTLCLLRAAASADEDFGDEIRTVWPLFNT
jgi:hypothetical protein